MILWRLLARLKRLLGLAAPTALPVCGIFFQAFPESDRNLICDVCGHEDWEHADDPQVMCPDCGGDCYAWDVDGRGCGRGATT